LDIGPCSYVNQPFDRIHTITIAYATGSATISTSIASGSATSAASRFYDFSYVAGPRIWDHSHFFGGECAHNPSVCAVHNPTSTSATTHMG
jgi:hypothetical protein